MGWENRNGKQYYYSKTRRNGRVRSSYIGAGEVARLGARLAEIDNQKRELERAQAQRQRDELNQLATAPEQLTSYAAAVRSTVTNILVSLGFHQHKRQWRYARMSDTQLTKREVYDTAYALYRKEKPSDEDTRKLRELLDKHTYLPRSLGDIARMAQQTILRPYEAYPGIHTAVVARISQMKDELGYWSSSEIEKMLIDEITLTWIDYYRMQNTYADASLDFTLSKMEQWDRILLAKQKRYLRAIETLARVRRLLKLPAMQVNIAQPGSQQVNMIGDLVTA